MIESVTVTNGPNMKHDWFAILVSLTFFVFTYTLCSVGEDPRIDRMLQWGGTGMGCSGR